MVLDVKTIFLNDNKSLPLDVEFNFSDIDFNGVHPLKKPVKVIGAVYNRASVVTLSVVCEVEYDAPCDRCGKEAVNDFKVPIEHVLVTALSSSEDNDEIIVIEDMKINLQELVYSEVLLNLPMKYLCSPGCKGICQNCGKNLNEEVCNCKKSEIDPRLKALEKLLNND